MANVLKVGTKIQKHTEMKPSVKQDQQVMNIGYEKYSNSMIGLPDVDMTNEQIVKAQKKEKLLFNEWYKTPQ